LLGDGQEDDDEGGGRTGNVEARATAQGNQRRGNQHGIQTMLRRHAHCDSQGHGQRNGNDAHRYAGQ